MRVRVDPEKCQGHVRCIQAVPEIFQEDEQGHSFTLDEDVPVELQLRVRQAERGGEKALVTSTSAARTCCMLAQCLAGLLRLKSREAHSPLTSAKSPNCRG